MQNLKHEFVGFVPEQLSDGVLYISIPYATVAHKCCCGCGREVVTPLSPTDWSLTFDGETVSLNPSVGNWSFPCRSHYWIRRNVIRWANEWTDAQIRLGRAHDSARKVRYYNRPDSTMPADLPEIAQPAASPPGNRSIWSRLRRFLGRK